MKSSTWDLAIWIINNNKIMKKRLNDYIQWDDYSCSLFSCLYILRTKFWILLNEKQREKIKNKAIEDKILSSKGSVFQFMFNWCTGYFKKELWINMQVVTYDINTYAFKNDLVHWNSFCIGLLKANKDYISSKKDDLINKSEIDKMVWTKHYGHALTYKLEYIIDSLDWWKIKLDYDDLLYWIDKEVFYPIARSFKCEDELLEYYLVQLNRWSVFERIEILDKEHYEAITKALQLRNYYRKG
jgi:hypothetical protein